MKTELSSTSGSWLAPSVTLGFGAAIAVWVTWFITHLPWLGLAEQVATPIVLGVWTMSVVLFTSRLSRRRARLIGVGASLVCALLSLLILGSKLVQQGEGGATTTSTVPSAPYLVLGFLALSIAIGLVGGLFGSFSARTDTPDQASSFWLARFGLVACLAVAPLLFIGGLVTSTNSGMAVPDWPQTFGANMFLYPLGSHTLPGVYLEHAHRLFGALIGLTTLAFMIFTLRCDTRRGVKMLAVTAFLVVCLQGVLGGYRVEIQTMLTGENTARAVKVGRWLAMGHGILAQIAYGLIVAWAVLVSNHFRSVRGVAQVLETAFARRVKFATTLLLHSLILQLVLGAMYRHTRSEHALWSHLGFSIVVVCAGLFAGFLLTSEPAKRSSVGRRLGQIGAGLVAVILLQFGLGWAAFIMGGEELTAASVGQALVRTAHQANGALLLALSVAAFVWGRRVVRGAGPARA